MDSRMRRRRFLQAASALGLGTGLGSPGLLRSITPARAEDLKIRPEAVQFRPEIEPLVRLLEETPRERILDVAVDRLRNGLSYRDLLSGLFLAGIRNVQPRPVGFKFHAVLVINSAHLLAQSASVEDRLLPLFWALDNFKNSQAQDVKEGDWTLSRVDESHLPSPSQAKAAFATAMDAWDTDAADAATAAYCRSAGAAEVMESFWKYGVRDHRDIGHKAIFAAQCWRTLQTIGWQNAEPVLRSLAYGMLDLRGDSQRAPVGPYASNPELSKTVRADWQVGRPDAGATVALLGVLREATPEDASAEVVKALNAGVAAGSLWDAVMLAGGEMLLRRPGILPLHAVTAANALHFIFGASGDDTTRKMALLQAAGWMPLYRQKGSAAPELRIDSLEALTPAGNGEDQVASIFATTGRDRTRAASHALGYLNAGGSPDLVFNTARRLIFRKGRDSHDYKYGAAAWEESLLASDPKWRAPLIAASMAQFPSADAPDSPLMIQAREALAKIASRS